MEDMEKDGERKMKRTDMISLKRRAKTAIIKIFPFY